MSSTIFNIDFSGLKFLSRSAAPIPNYPHPTFFNPQFAPHPDLPIKIIVDRVIHDGDSSTVYAAHGDAASGAPRSLNLALKFAPAIDLVEEADAGAIFLWVLFESTRKRGLGCLITELWGSSLEHEFHELPKAHKAIILQKLANIHAVGIIHNDFEPYNVLQKDGDFRIIDFGNFEEHECRQPKDFNFGAVGEYLDRSQAKLLCPNIRWIAHDMRLWEEGEVELHNGYFVKKSQHKLPDQHLIYQFPLPDRYHYVEFSRQEQWKLEFYLELQRQLDRGMSLKDLGKEENVAQRTAIAEEKTSSVKRKLTRLVREPGRRRKRKSNPEICDLENFLICTT
ncbi:hypothetical protein C8J56DRAFT_1028175 [Mycena floridula]|nr:hypothetical protein C8J56DRAFT_1028175 [Mycena floridula]